MSDDGGRRTLFHPPLEGEGRERSERGGVMLSSITSPHPDRLASLRSTPAVDPPPPGEGKEWRGLQPVETA